MSLKVDYVDAVYTGKKKYTITANGDGTSTITDSTEYSQKGTQFGAKDINETNAAVNRLQGLLTVTLPAANWTGTTAPYSQTVNVPGITADDNPTMTRTLTGAEDAATIKAYEKAYGFIFAGQTRDGTVTFYAKKLPTTDITVGLKGV